MHATRFITECGCVRLYVGIEEGDFLAEIHFDCSKFGNKIINKNTKRSRYLNSIKNIHSIKIAAMIAR